MPAGTMLASRKPRRAANYDAVTYEPCLLGIRGHVVHRVPNGLEVGDRLVRDLDAEHLLRVYGYLHHGQRIDLQIVLKGLFHGHLVLRHSGRDVFDDLGKAGEDLYVVNHWLFPSPCSRWTAR